MTENDVLAFQGAAKVVGAAARLMARVAGMQAENNSRADQGKAPAYGEAAFNQAIVDEGADWNSQCENIRAGR